MPHQVAIRHAGSSHSLRRLIVAVVAAIVVLPSAAFAERPQFGAKVGPSFTGILLAEDDGQDYHPRIAAAGGGFVGFRLTRRVSLQVEGMSSPKGTRLEDDGIAQTLMLRYFEVPALVRVQGPRLGAGAVYFIAGPFVGIRTSAKEEVSAVINSVKAGARETVMDKIERFETGLLAGAGLDIGRHLVVETRYSHGLTNANRVDGAPRFTNRGLSFATGVRF